MIIHYVPVKVCPPNARLLNIFKNQININRLENVVISTEGEEAFEKSTSNL